MNCPASLCHSGSRPELHPVAAHGWADPAQTQPAPQGPAALRQTHGVAEEHPQGEVRGPVQGQYFRILKGILEIHV